MGFDPISMGVMAAATIAQGAMANSDARREGRALDENARQTELQGAYDMTDALRRSRIEAGSELTASAAGGGAAGEGSVADMIYANAIERQAESLNIVQSAGQQARGLRTQAKDARRRGKNALIGSLFRAGAGALQGINSMNNAGQVESAVGAARAATLQQPLGTIPIPSGSSIVQPGPNAPRQSPWVMNMRGPR